VKERRKLIKINLIAREVKKKKVPSRYWGIIPILLGLILGILISFGVDYSYTAKVNRLKKEVEVKRNRLKVLSPYVRKLKETEAKLSRLKKMKEIISKIVKEAHVPLKVIQTVEASIPYEVWLKEMSLSGKKLKLKGYSLNDEKIADFLENLSKSELITKVSISYIKKVTVNKFPVKEFSAEVTIK